MLSWVQRLSQTVDGCNIKIKDTFNSSVLAKKANKAQHLFFGKNNSILVKQNEGFDADFESVEKTNATVRQPNALVDFIPHSETMNLVMAL
jgi:hypothetical protein